MQVVRRHIYRRDKEQELTVSYERRTGELTKPRSMELLGSVPVGRVVFTHHALPTVRPVNHLVADDLIAKQGSP